MVDAVDLVVVEAGTEEGVMTVVVAMIEVLLEVDTVGGTEADLEAMRHTRYCVGGGSHYWACDNRPVTVERPAYSRICAG